MEGPPELWAKALALGLLQVATMQRRHCRVVAFSSSVVRVHDWRPGDVESVALIESMLPFDGGGTEFEPPLKAALQSIEAEPTLRHADIIVITDGVAEVTEGFLQEWREARKRLGFATYAIHIATAGDEPAPILKELADQVLRRSCNSPCFSTWSRWVELLALPAPMTRLASLHRKRRLKEPANPLRSTSIRLESAPRGPADGLSPHSRSNVPRTEPRRAADHHRAAVRE